MFYENDGSFSAEKFWEHLIQEGEKVACDETNSHFWKQDVQVPHFYNQLKFKKGQEFFHDYLGSMIGVSLFGLIAVLNDPIGTKILHNTRISGDPYSAYKRYMDTLRHVLTWYSYDFTPNSELWKSILTVKKMHNAASNKGIKDGLYRINNRWMSETLFGFMGLAITRPDKFGLGKVSKEDQDALVHFWRVIGWLLGIEDRFNICRDSLEETHAVCDIFIDRYLKRWIYLRDPDCLQHQMALIRGIATILPFTDIDLTYNSVLDLIEPRSKKNRHIYCKTNFLQELVSLLFHFSLDLLEYDGFRRFSNIHVRYMVIGLLASEEIAEDIFAGRSPCVMFS